MRRKKGVPGNHGLERGIGHTQAQTVLNPIPLIGLTERDGGPGHDQKMKGEGGDPGKYITVFQIYFILIRQ